MLSNYIQTNESNLGISHSIDFLLSDTYSKDAALNLFELYIEPVDDTSKKAISKQIKDSNSDFSIYSCRINYIKAPKRSVSTVNLSYQNVEIPIVSNGVDQDKSIEFTLRIDSDYMTIKALEASMPYNINGDEQSSYKWNITLYAYKNNLADTKEDFTPARKWKFKDCMITNISSYNYDYGTSGSPTVTVTFIYSTVDAE